MATENEQQDTTPKVEPTEQTGSQTGAEQEPTDTDVQDWKLSSRNWERQARKNADAAEKWNEFINKTSPELTKRLETLEAENKSLKLSSIKAKVAKEVGLVDELVGRLTGETEEDLKKDAESLKLIFDSVVNNSGSKKPQVQPDKIQGPSDNTNNIKNVIKTEEDLKNFLLSKQK